MDEEEEAYAREEEEAVERVYKICYWIQAIKETLWAEYGAIRIWG